MGSAEQSHSTVWAHLTRVKAEPTIWCGNQRIWAPAVAPLGTPMGLESSSMPSPVRALKQRRGWPERAFEPCCPPNRVLPPAEIGCRPTGRPPRSAAWARNDRPSQPLRVAAPAVVRDNDVLAHRSFRGLHTTRAIGRALFAPAPAPAAYRERNAPSGPARKRDVTWRREP